MRCLCRVLDVHPSGHYAWRKIPHFVRHKTDQRLTGLINQFWLESGGVYGYRKLHSDLRDIGEVCSVNRALRLMRLAQLLAQVGFRRPRQRGGFSHVVVPNKLQR